MIKKDVITRKVVQRWVSGFYSIPQRMIKALVHRDIDSWHEVTRPRIGDLVSVCNFPKEDTDGNIVSDTDIQKQGRVQYLINEEKYLIQLWDDKTEIISSLDDLKMQHYEVLPMPETMWSFSDPIDVLWLKKCGLQIMSDCGLRIYQHNELGFFFGVDDTGYDYYKKHWIPLYKAIRLTCWRNPEI